MDQGHITYLIHRWIGGDPNALNNLVTETYQELYKIAQSQMAREYSNQTYSPTILLNEAFLKLKSIHKSKFENRKHFFAMAALLMRRIMVDHSKATSAQKRKGELVSLDLSHNLGSRFAKVDLLALNQAMERLAQKDARQSQLVELRFFGGFSMRECAEFIGVSTRTAEYEWAMARAWLLGQLRMGVPSV